MECALLVDCVCVGTYVPACNMDLSVSKLDLVH